MIGPRHSSVLVPVVGAAAVWYGLALLLGSADDFRSASFDVPFDVLPRRWWGSGFLAAGAGVYVVHHAAAVLALCAVMASWAASVALGALTVEGVPPSAPTWSAALAVGLLLSIAKRGVRPSGR